MKHLSLLAALATILVSSSVSAQTAEKPKESSPDGAPQISLVVRGGLTGDVAFADPNFYGIGGVVEPTISVNDVFGAGLRIDGMALFGIGLGDDVQAGIRVLAGVLPKVEYKFFRGPVQPVVGLAGGYYTIAAVGASVSADRDDVGALAGGGQAFGLAPQVGIELGSFRVAALSHFILGSQLEPVLALELSWNTFSFDF